MPRRAGRRASRVLPTIVVSIAMLVAACGGDEDDARRPTTTRPRAAPKPPSCSVPRTPRPANRSRSGSCRTAPPGLRQHRRATRRPGHRGLLERAPGRHRRAADRARDLRDRRRPGRRHRLRQPDGRERGRGRRPRPVRRGRRGVGAAARSRACRRCSCRPAQRACSPTPRRASSCPTRSRPRSACRSRWPRARAPTGGLRQHRRRRWPSLSFDSGAAPALLENAGLDYDLIKMPPGTADMTSQMGEIANSGAGVVQHRRQRRLLHRRHPGAGRRRVRGRDHGGVAVHHRRDPRGDPGDQLEGISSPPAWPWARRTTRRTSSTRR